MSKTPGDNDRELIDATLIMFLSALGMAVMRADEPEAVVLTVADTLAAEAIIMLEKMCGVPTDVALAKHIEHVKMVLQADRRASEH